MTMLEEVTPRSPPETKGAQSLIKPPFSSREVGLPQSKARLKYRPEDDILVHSTTQAESRATGELVLKMATSTLNHTQNPRTSLNHLPLDLQENIIGYTHGSLGPAFIDASTSGHTARNWSMAMRHPRRKQLSDLSLVSKSWRKLVQQRLYRHIKIKGTKAELQACETWFLTRPHLQSFVKHLEIWVPVWEMKDGRSIIQTTVEVVFNEGRPAPRAAQAGWLTTTQVRHFEESSNIALAYQPASHNATLEEIFACADLLFPHICALTIEGGHCKKPPRIPYFRRAQSPPGNVSSTDEESPSSQFFPSNRSAHKPQLTTLPTVSTLVLKGAWNIIRKNTDFDILAQALPNLREWHCAYSKPKTDGYIAACGILQHFPRNIVRLNLCLEGLYAKEDVAPSKWRKIYPVNHICLNLGLLGPQLERFTYTGRMCAKIFQSACKAANPQSRDRPPLKSVDLVIKNSCRDNPRNWTDGAGVHNLEFIQHFEQLVTEACRALEVFANLAYLRIRFIDLDSPNPVLNPHFHLDPDGTCFGFYNDEILKLLQRARPHVIFEGMEEAAGFEDGMDGERSRNKPRSIHVRRYMAIADPGNMD